jgi:integrase
MVKPLRLTVSLIEGVRENTRERWLSDDSGSRGAGRLAIRVSPNGKKRFYFRYFLGGKRVLIPLGLYSKNQAANCLTLEQAREVAMHYAFATHFNAIDLRQALISRVALATPPSSHAAVNAPVDASAHVANVPQRTLIDLCEAYVEHLRNRKAQSASTVASIIKNHVGSTKLAVLPAADLTAEQATELIRTVVNAGHLTTAKHLRQYLQAAYNLAKRGGKDPTIPASFKDFGIVNNPVSETASMSSAIKARERPVLSKLELGHIWLELCQSEHDLSVAFRALRLNFCLGGQRSLQLLRCKVSDVDIDRALIVLHDGKGRRTSPRKHFLPLTKEAMVEVLALRQMALDLGNPFLIPGAIKSKQLTPGPISKTVTEISRKLLRSKVLVEPFCYANIRSTIETSMAELDIPADVRAEIQSHGMGGIQKKFYDQWTYLPQKLKALEKWQKYLNESTDLAKLTSSVSSSKAK